MAKHNWRLLAFVFFGGVFVPGSSLAQVTRYEPATPTVSPYLNLFQSNRTNAAIPNYYSLVRPLQIQNQTNQIQQRILQQQGGALTKVEDNLQQLEQRQRTGQSLVPTGHGGWFGNPGTRTKFLNTSTYYSRAGTLPPRPQ